MRRRRDPDHVVRDVGRKIAELRSERGLTQATFAEALGITTGHLQKIELGKLNLTIHSLARLAHELHVGIGELFDPPESQTVRRGRPPRVADDG